MLIKIISDIYSSDETGKHTNHLIFLKDLIMKNETFADVIFNSLSAALSEAGRISTIEYIRAEIEKLQQRKADKKFLCKKNFQRLQTAFAQYQETGDEKQKQTCQQIIRRMNSAVWWFWFYFLFISRINMITSRKSKNWFEVELTKLSNRLKVLIHFKMKAEQANDKNKITSIDIEICK